MNILFSLLLDVRANLLILTLLVSWYVLPFSLKRPHEEALLPLVLENRVAESRRGY